MRQLADNGALLIAILAPSIIGIFMLRVEIVHLLIAVPFQQVTLAVLPLSVLAGSITWQFGGARLILSGAIVIGLLTATRALSLLQEGERSMATVSEAGQAIAVAGVYDMARALALISRGGHELRRRA